MSDVAHAARTARHLRGLSLLLNLEYLQAELYTRALDGAGLGDDERGDAAGPVIGGRRVAFDNPLVGAFVKGAAREERDHIVLLREMFEELDADPVSAPTIDLDRSFAALARRAGVARDDQTFDAFANDTNLLFAAYMVEDVVGTAYQGVLTEADGSATLARLAAIAAAEAGHSAIIRLMLLSAGLGNETNAISVIRQNVCGMAGTCFQGGDHGIGTLGEPSILAIDGRSMAWGRTIEQCLAILYGERDAAAGLFFPSGINDGSIAARARYTPVFLGSLADLSADDPPAKELRVFPSERVDLPAIRWGETKAPGFGSGQEIAATTQDHFWSTTPRVLEIAGALILGAVGIVAVRDVVIQESMWHTDPSRHRYKRDGNVVTLRTPSIETLPGTTVSILTGAAESYWHSLVDATLRLMLIDDEIWRRTTRLLLPSTGIRQDDLVALFRIPDWVEVRTVQPSETFRAETLILPSSVHGMFDFHPAVTNAFFDRLLGHAGPATATPIRRLFIDRRGSGLRRLVCEADLIDALPGFQPVQLETLSISDQALLFAEADIIVAPHGAGLTNVGFARPGTIVIEMMMDTYRNWCFRRLAAARGLVYFCVLGRSIDPEKAAESVHLQTWTVDIADVRGAVDQAERGLQARQG